LMITKAAARGAAFLFASAGFLLISSQVPS